jgi:hypothetical protein
VEYVTAYRKLIVFVAVARVKARLPVRSALYKKDTSGLVVRWMTTSKSVRSQAKDSRKAMIEQSEFDEELSEQEGRLLL